MKKQLFKSGKKGILIGLVVSMIMSLIWAPSYMPSGSRIHGIGLLPHHLVCYRYPL